MSLDWRAAAAFANPPAPHGKEETEVGMGMDDLLILMILVGIVLSGAYLRAEFLLCRARRTAEQRNAAKRLQEVA
jgi:hypothetical protein